MDVSGLGSVSIETAQGYFEFINNQIREITAASGLELEKRIRLAFSSVRFANDLFEWIFRRKKPIQS